ncbi:hypothetical protein BB560_003606 [Smittium megazygosporum]|uniref:Uncharacterized protein n=1 Tax=Smittium megazygosporum TaxID=133381 RepID=A0A2T9ZBL2_9FUNG|nr:hypothetical protein BB560_003606 [Smittium megazygosporum]
MSKILQNAYSSLLKSKASFLSGHRTFFKYETPKTECLSKSISSAHDKNFNMTSKYISTNSLSLNTKPNIITAPELAQHEDAVSSNMSCNYIFKLNEHNLVPILFQRPPASVKSYPDNRDKDLKSDKKSDFNFLNQGEKGSNTQKRKYESNQQSPPHMKKEHNRYNISPEQSQKNKGCDKKYS